MHLNSGIWWKLQILNTWDHRRAEPHVYISIYPVICACVQYNAFASKRFMTNQLIAQFAS